MNARHGPSFWLTTLICLLLGSSAWATGPATSPADADITRQTLIDEIHRLRERIERLEQNGPTADAARDAARAREADRAVDKAVADVLADADRRSQLLQLQGFTGGYSGGRFLIQSEDGNFVFNPGALLQVRYDANHRDGGDPSGDDSTESGFEVRRLWLLFSGNVFTPRLTYHFQFGTGVNGGELRMDQAWVRYAFADSPFAVRFGAYTNTWDHETAVFIGRQLAVDRSVLNQVIATGGTGVENYVQGIELQYQSIDEWRASVMVHDGMLTRNTNFQNEATTAPAIGIVNPNGGAAGRFEYKLAGDWRDYVDFTARGTQKDLLVVGGGFNVDTADNLNAYMYTVDAQWEPASVPGLGVYGAFVGMYRDFRNITTGGGSANDWGFVGQAGYLLSPKWEVFGRYSFTKLDDNAPGGPGTIGAAARVNDTIHEITAGVNYYPYDHNAKVSVDAVFLPEGSPLNLPGIAILSQTTSDPQMAVRAQFQLMY